MTAPPGPARLAARRAPNAAGPILRLLLTVAAAAHLAALLLLACSAQYISASSLAGCDSAKLLRCQQEVLRDMQPSLAGSGALLSPAQYISQGPPYSPKQQFQLLQQRQQQQQQQLQLQLQQGPMAAATTCRLVRSNLDCLLACTPACYELGVQSAQNTDIILRAKRYLEQNRCNEPDASWHSTFCYRSPEVRNCEDRYGFGAANVAFNSPLSNSSACLAYAAFKYCVDTHLRYNCKVHEMDMINEYLIERASDLAWRCPANSSAGVAPERLTGYASTYGGSLSPSVASSALGYSAYDQRPIPAYSGGGAAALAGYQSSGGRPQAWDRFRDPLDEASKFGVARLPGSGAQPGDVFDRLVSANGFETVDTSDCPVKAAPYARECEDTLSDQQRLARDSRDGHELQRRFCCALFHYRDCISRVVLDRCADSSPTAVEILMGARRREITLTCRGFNRDVCSGALKEASLSRLLLLASLLLTSALSLLGAKRRGDA